jgi:hypothetical protein
VVQDMAAFVFVPSCVGTCFAAVKKEEGRKHHRHSFCLGSAGVLQIYRQTGQEDDRQVEVQHQQHHKRQCSILFPIHVCIS